MSDRLESDERVSPNEAFTRPENPWRFRVILYGTLLLLVAAAYAFTHYSLIPGIDPYFFDRQTVDVEILEEDGRRYLWGGDGPGQRFDISSFHLNPNHLEYALGRERIPALIAPRFTSISRAQTTLTPDDRTLVAKIGDEVKLYPISILMHHEAVNDTLGGKPILVAYCLLAELGAIYDRSYGDTTYTFGVSGYTYYDWKTWKGRSAFVLWDRETESLWWPPVGKAVSGSSIDIPMNVLDKKLWAQMTWAKAIARFPDALVLDDGQDVEIPDAWPRLKPSDIERVEGRIPRSAIAPHWGENPRL